MIKNGRRGDNAMPIDLLNVSWLYVIVLGVFVFVASFIGNLLSFSHRGWAAALSALAFIVMFIFWTYYPHGLPLPTRLTSDEPAAAEPVGLPQPQADTPQKPRNPVSDITPPKNPVTTITPPAGNAPPASNKPQ
jgi:hypothetical protein